MKPLFTQDDFNQSDSKTLLPCMCYQCNIIFFKTKRQIAQVLNPNSTSVGKYCSDSCMSLARKTKQKVICKNCSIEFEKFTKEIQKSPNHFCSKSCAATYNNKNKTHGNRRSKLEIWLEEKLASIYPNLEIHFNQKTVIQSELDIYIPSLKLAFELNGIFHYEPIYGENKLNKIQNNDQNKFQACLENGISLCIIDTSMQTYFKPTSSKKYLDIITKIIDCR